MSIQGRWKRFKHQDAPFLSMPGSTPNTEDYPELETKDGYIITNEKQETNLAGVYAAAGTCVKQVRQAATAVADGAVAAIHAAAYIKAQR